MAELQLDSDAAAVARALYSAAGELSKLEAANEAAGAIIVAAQPPRRSGLLAASVRADVTRQGLTVAGHVRYWTFVHWGAPRRHVRANPWLLAQLEDRTEDIVKVYTEHAARAVARAGG